MSVVLALRVLLGLFMVDCLIEMSFIASMVSWVARNFKSFEILHGGSSFQLFGKPLQMVGDQGHAANGVAGTGIIVVGIFGFIALWLRNKPDYHSSRLSNIFYKFWLYVSTLAFVYTLATLAYVFAVTNMHHGTTIDIAVASALKPTQKYPDDTWTPQGWFGAMLKLDLAKQSDRNEISLHLRLMKGWLFNMIPVFILHLAITVLMWMDAMARRKKDSYGRPGKETLPMTP
ncbi:hypothetical protein NQ176_g5619 [Zarea fungicola]|uniref:Uncharacterized protein n=1 Tax=Zarea fungicola TaxID=93591 RepID=A0ACC1N852_9HYPO|nr:hypothetical protein NQ176_g5619 [Lecanicillium fungicola]